MRENHRTSRASIARIKAYECLEIIRKRDAFAHDIIESVINTAKLDKQDRAFATKLVMGVVMMRASLNTVLDKCMRSPHDVKSNVRSALQISTYELLYLDKSPHAAIDQGVELVRFVEPKATGVANAVLRNVSRAAQAFPFGDPHQSMQAFALQEGFPLWLAEMLAHELGESPSRAFMEISNEVAPVYVAINPLLGHEKETAQEIASIDPKAHPHQIDGHTVSGCVRLDKRSSLADGRFQRLLKACDVLVSDAAAQYIVQLACAACVQTAQERKAHHELSCLELCAGRGTKTILLQSELMRLVGHQFDRFIALDNVAFKVKLLQQRAHDYGAHLTRALCKDGTKLSYEDVSDPKSSHKDAPFDLVFLDTPCSGLGTIRRHPEIRWRITPHAIAEDAKRDLILLKSAAKFVAEGGILAYSTCTITSQENEHAVRAFLDSEEGRAFKLIPIDGKPIFKTMLQTGSSDAHFCALLLRTGIKEID